MKRLLLIALLAGASLAPSATAARTLRLTDHLVRQHQDVAACQAQPILRWCNSGAVGGRSPTLEALELADARARAGLEQGVSHEGEDDWRSYADEALANKPWRGFCANLTATVLDLLVREGYDPRKMWRVEVISDDIPGRAIDVHMVALVEVDGEYWIVGDTVSPKKAPYRFAGAPYTVRYASNVAEGYLWHQAR